MGTLETPRRYRARIAVYFGLCLLGIGGCVTDSEFERYRLGDAGPGWSGGHQDPLTQELLARYPAYFAVILDPSSIVDPDLRPLERDLIQNPVGRDNYDALNAVAIGYFAINARTLSDLSGPGFGGTYFADSFRTAQLIAVPGHAYGEISDPELRNAVLDFFEDIAAGQKRGSRATRPGLAVTVADLETKESDPARRERIRGIAERLRDPVPSSAATNGG